MRLSEAIRLGAMLEPQVYWYLRAVITYPPVFGDILGLDRSYTGSCALGAALRAVGLDWIPSEELGARLIEYFGSDVVRLLRGDCPACAESYVGNLVAHLNNEHRWTRERIADFVEEQELPESAQAIDLVLSNSVDPSTRENASDRNIGSEKRLA